MIRPISLAATTILVAASATAQTVAYSPADVQFMQGMIGHHAQALAMTALVDSRTNRSDLHSLAERITISQRDEIKLMQTWLRDHHEEVPSADMADMPGMSHPLMPGMLTAEQMTQLAGANGAAFERLFLADMIQHHEGARAMVRKLFGTSGAAQASEIFRFASDVETDQRAEIARMRALLNAMPQSTSSH